MGSDGFGWVLDGFGWVWMGFGWVWMGFGWVCTAFHGPPFVYPTVGDHFLFYENLSCVLQNVILNCDIYCVKVYVNIYVGRDVAVVLGI